MISSVLRSVVPFRRGIAFRMYFIGSLALFSVLLLAGAAIYFAGITGRAAQVLFDGSLVGVVEANEMELLLEKHRRIVEAAPLEFDRTQIRNDRQMAEEISGRIEQLVRQSDDALGVRIGQSLSELVRLGRDVLHLADNFAQQKGLEVVSDYVKVAEFIQDEVRAFRRERVQIADSETASLARKGRLLVQGVTTLAVMALLLIGPLSLMLIRGLVVRLRDITDAMTKLARNETAVEVRSAGSDDEIGEMARAVEVFKANAVMLLDQKARLEKLNVWLDIAFNNMTRGLSMFDSERRLVVCNASYARMYSLPDELIRPGTKLASIVAHRRRFADGIEGDLREPDATEIVARANETGSARPEVRSSVKMRNGRIIDVSIRPLEAGGWVALHEDVTEQRKANEQIVRLAHHDTLTGLSNRLQFRQRLEAAVQGAAARREFALHCIDLDKFKDVNDTLGHPVGDLLLAAVARRLEAAVRPSDVVARLGGDEFAVIQLDVDSHSDAQALAERLIGAVCEPYQIQGQRVVVGATIGIVLAPGDGADADVLLRNADMALYRAKEDGRGRAVFFDPEMEGRLRARRLLEADLARAISEDQLELFYQPIIDLGSRVTVGCEALIRWRHPTRGLVPPNDFIPVAEETGLIVAIGAWALQRATRDAALWDGDVKVAVNLSAAQFGTCDLVAIASEALLMSGLKPQRLELEVTESLILDDHPETIEVLHRLRALGVRIALDDFGTGYSSLSYLRSFPFDKIKIDQTFVRDLPQRRDCVAIVGAVALLARSLEMTTVAEGVETNDHLAMVRAAGCTEAQGYLFSRPVPASEIASVIARCNEELGRIVMAA